MDVGGVLSRAWQIIWKYKILWIFGILASCSGGGANPGSSGSRYDYSSSELPPGVQAYFNKFSQFTNEQIAGLVIIFIVVVLVLVALLVFLSTMGKIGLIRGTQQAEGGAERLSFGELFRGGLPYFWRVFLLNLLVGIGVAVVVGAIVAFVVLATVASLGIFAICFFPLLCVGALAFLFGAWLINVVIEQANNAIILENLGIMAALERGWEVFKGNFGTMVVMGLILQLGIQGILGFILGIPIFVVLVPVIIGAAAQTTQALWTGALISGLCLVVYLPVFIVLMGILRGYVGTAWTLTYMRLTGKPAVVALEPKVETTI